MKRAERLGWLGLGLAQNQTGRYGQAAESYDRALLLDPDNVEVLYNRAVALAADNRPEEAIAAFQAVLAVDPENSCARAGINLTSARIDMY